MLSSNNSQPVSGSFIRVYRAARTYVNIFMLFAFLCSATICGAKSIDRKAVVARHNVVVSKPDTFSSLTIGNGEFAFTTDFTGLQTFPEYYQHGVPLGTQSEWGWHSFPNTEQFEFAETLRDYDLNGKERAYSVQSKLPERKKAACDYFRVNQHRLQLGNIGFRILLNNGMPAQIADYKDIHQELDLWTGVISSFFTVEGQSVKVTTAGAQSVDGISVKVESPLVKAGRILLCVQFPYPTGSFSDFGTNYNNAQKHNSYWKQQADSGGVFTHRLDTTTYYLHTSSNKAIRVIEDTEHKFIITPSRASDKFTASFVFSQIDTVSAVPFDKTLKESREMWKQYWRSGAAVDFSQSTAKDAMELERRVVLSQYLLRVQEAGHFPPQETGLTYNSWYGKPHMEMVWWHLAQYAFWGRPALLEKSMGWYFSARDGARAIAQRQGYDGIRWQKMTDNEGNESPSSVGAFLIWQQPHLIYLAEMLYRAHPDQKTLDRYKDLVFETAEFMASFPSWDSVNGRYNLGKGLIPAQECFEAVETYNPTYELAYWDWALNIALQWRARLGLPSNSMWDDVIKNLAQLPQKDGVYLAAESTPDCYEVGNRRLTDHPAVLAALAAIPASHGLDTATMHRTLDTVWKKWVWNHTWGWDFPLTAMTAARLHQPEKAIDALLMPIQTNTYLPNGHNYQDERLTIYLPGNGGLLSVISLLCTDGTKDLQTSTGVRAFGEYTLIFENFQKFP